ncbi:MAG TPA: SRPBCC family protein [Pirellulales bacterium]|nr:SRPBCC family protein [Pirellulales bacterium]
MNQNAIQIVPSPQGQGFRLEARQLLRVNREELFVFFSDANQLETITPPWLRFSVHAPAPIQIRAGTLIDYRLRVHGLPLRWQSRITVWDPPLRFVDEQIRGPYRRWHHEHLFEEADGATLCRDIVDYAVPGGWLIHSLLVRRDVLRIFEFRQQQLQRQFGGG